MSDLQQEHEGISRGIDVATPAEQFTQFAIALRRIHQCGALASLLFKLAGQLQDDVSTLDKDLASGDLALGGMAPGNLIYLQREATWIADMLTGTQARMEGVELVRSNMTHHFSPASAACRLELDR